MRCQKSKRICPGYRDAFELKLRDENKSTKKRSSRKSPPLNGSQEAYSVDDPYAFMGPSVHFSTPTIFSSELTLGRTSLESSSSSYDDSQTREVAAQAHQNHGIITTYMTTPIHQQAACYFLSNFVLIPEEGTMRGYLDFILPLIKKRDPSPALLQSFSAVALAALGSRPNSKALIPKAESWYLNALKEINRCLQDPLLASNDSTLASIMLLAAFEVSTETGLRNSNADKSCSNLFHLS